MFPYSGYYSWLNRTPIKKKLENKNLKIKIAEIYWQNRVKYGSPRIHKKLKNTDEKTWIKSQAKKEV